MPHDANTFNVCGEMLSGWQDSFFFEADTATCRRSVTDQSLISRRSVAEDFRVKAFIKSAIDRRLISDF